MKIIAKAVNVSSISVHRFEYGTVRPSLDTLMGVSDLEIHNKWNL